jgi:hypothetical protein
VLCSLRNRTKHSGARPRLLLIGGWDPSEEKHPTWTLESTDPTVIRGDELEKGRALTTNEIWASDDDGATWHLLRGHLPNPKQSTTPRFERVHTPAWAQDDDYFYLIGGDIYRPHSEVWRTHLDGDGTKWEYRGTIPWGNRFFSMAGIINGKLYAMGGQETLHPGTASKDVWWSGNGGQTWHLMPAQSMWSPRGMVYGMPVIYNEKKGREELYLVGGAIYQHEYFDGVFKFDGITWEQVRPDTPINVSPADPWPDGGGRGYHNVVLTAPGPGYPDGLMWVITGSTWGQPSCKTLLISKDKGKTWTVLLRADWGLEPTGSHADAVTVHKGDIIRASGNAFDRSTYRIHQVTVAEFLKRRAPVVTRVTPLEGEEGETITVRGVGFENACAVRIDVGDVNTVYVTFTTPVVDPADPALEMFTFTMPDVYVPPTVKVREPYNVFIVVVNPDGSSPYPAGAFGYIWW